MKSTEQKQVTNRVVDNEFLVLGLRVTSVAYRHEYDIQQRGTHGLPQWQS